MEFRESIGGGNSRANGSRAIGNGERAGVLQLGERDPEEDP